MHNKNFITFIVFSLVFAMIFMGCATNKTILQNEAVGLNSENVVVNPDPALFGTWTWTQDENFKIKAVISADIMEYEFHNLGSHSVSVILSDITWIIEENSDLSYSLHYPTGYRIQGTVTANSIYVPENVIWPEEIGNIYSISIFINQNDSQKALILYDELEKLY